MNIFECGKEERERDRDRLTNRMALSLHVGRGK